MLDFIFSKTHNGRLEISGTPGTQQYQKKRAIWEARDTKKTRNTWESMQEDQGYQRY